MQLPRSVHKYCIWLICCLYLLSYFDTVRWKSGGTSEWVESHFSRSHFRNAKVYIVHVEQEQEFN